MNTEWQIAKKNSKYHFDNFKIDSERDKVVKMGRIVADYKPNTILEKVKQITDLFGLAQCESVVLTQLPGEVLSLHIDDLSSYNPDHLYGIVRIHVALSDWEPGHYWGYGNYLHQFWKAGDVTTYDWQNIPYSTANAGHNARTTLQLTGNITPKTTEFMNRLKRFDSHTLDLKESSW